MLSLQSLCMHDVVVYCLKIVVINPSVGRCGPWFQSNCSATVAFQSATTRQTRCRPEISTHDKQRTTTTKIMNDFVRCLSCAVVYSMNRTDGFVEMKLIVARTFVHCFLLSRCTSLSLFFFFFVCVLLRSAPVRLSPPTMSTPYITCPLHGCRFAMAWHDDDVRRRPTFAQRTQRQSKTSSIDLKRNQFFSIIYFVSFCWSVPAGANNK